MLCVGIDKNSINTDEDYYCKVCKLNSPVPDHANQNNEPGNSASSKVSSKPSSPSKASKSSKMDETLPQENVSDSKEQIGNKIQIGGIQEKDNSATLTDTDVDSVKSNIIEKNSSTEEKMLLSDDKALSDETNLDTVTHSEKEINSSTITSNVEQSDIKTKASKETEKSTLKEECNNVSMKEVDNDTRPQKKISAECALPELGNKVECSVNITSTLNGNVNGTGLLESEKQAVF